MNFKKSLAVLLAVATVFTSQAFTTAAYAAEESLTAATIETAADKENAGGNEDAAKAGTTDGASGNASNESGTLPDGTDNGSGTAKADDSTKADDKTLEDAAAANDGEETQLEDPVLSKEGDETLTEEEVIADEEALAEEILTDTETLETIEDEELEAKAEITSFPDESILKSADYFTVDDNGKLKIKDNVSKNALPSTVYIPGECTEIGDDIFKNNSKIKKIKFDATYEEDGVKKDAEGVSTIAEGAFQSSTLEEIDLSTTKITAIPNKAFRNSSLSKITLPASVTVIGDSAFENTLLTSVASSYVTELKEDAFLNCKKLTSVNFAKLEVIGDSAFSGCTSLASGMDFATTITDIGTSAFEGCALVNVNLTQLSSLKTIDTAAFKDNTKLAYFYFPTNAANYTEISNSCFENCTSLTKISLPLKANSNSITTNIKSIYGSAFAGCTKLAEVDLALADYIASKAFYNCSTLNKIYLRTPKTNTSLYIAQEAFPAKSGIMYGYSDYVQDYAISRGYTFTDLRTAYSISTTIYNSSGGTVTLSKKSARVGDKVTITLTPKSNYVHDGIQLTDLSGQDIGKYVGEDDYVNLTFEGATDKEIKYSFTMPDYAVKVIETFSLKKDKSTSNITYKFKVPADNLELSDEADYVTGSSGNYYIDKQGRRAALYITYDGSAMYNVYEWTFKSGNTSVVNVTDKGILTAVATGSAQITATHRATGKYITFKMNVDESTQIKDVRVTGIDCSIKAEVSNYNKPQEADCDNKNATILFTKAYMALGAQTLTFDIGAFTDSTATEDNAVISYWTSSDTSIATVASSTSRTNSNTITVKKGTVGEVQITASVLNVGESKVNSEDGEANIATFTIKVTDPLPRLNNTTLTVDTNSSQGTKLELVEVYGYNISDDVGLTLVDSKYNVCYDFEIYYDDDKEAFYMITGDNLTKLTAGKKQTYKNMYLRGEYKSSGDMFYTPVTLITAINQTTKPTITTSGKINLFYNSTASAAEIGSVMITQSLSNLNVTSYDLVSKTNYNLYGTSALKSSTHNTDAFCKNFDITTNLGDGITNTNNQRAIITKSDNEMIKGVNGDTAGYLYITYEGYRYPIMMPITIPTTVTAPTYVLSMTSAAANTNVSNQEYRPYIYVKGKTVPVDLSKVDYIAIDNNKTTVLNAFEDMSLNTTTFAYDDSTVYKTGEQDAGGNDIYALHLNVDGTPVACSLVFNMHMSTWSDYGSKTKANPSAKTYIPFTFKLTTTNAVPTAVSSAKSITLNRAYGKDSQYIKLTTNQTDACVVRFDSINHPAPGSWTDKKGVAYSGCASFTGGILPTANKLTQGATYQAACELLDKMTYYMDANKGGYMLFDVNDFSNIPKGTYSYTAYPVAMYGGTYNESNKMWEGGTCVALKAVSFSIVVAENKPSISLKSSTFTVNMGTLAGINSATTDITLSNMVAGTTVYDYKIDSLAASYTVLDAKGNVTTKSLADINYDNPVYSEATAATTLAAAVPMKMTMTRKSADEYYTADATYKLKVSGLKLTLYTEDEDGNSIPAGPSAAIPDFTVTLKGITATPAFTVKSSGTINLINSASAITYTCTLSNTVDTITSVTLTEYDSYGRALDADDAHFAAALNTSNDKIAYVYVKDTESSENLVPKKAYNISLSYGVGGTVTNPKFKTANPLKFTITPTQTYSTLTVTTDKTDLYTGAVLAKDRTVTVTVKVPYNMIGGMEIDSIGWPSNVSSVYKSAFTIGAVTQTAAQKAAGEFVFTLYLKDGSSLVQNKTYTLTLVPHYKGQATDTYANGISVKTTIKK